jgi:tripeptidyl-peptidase-2
MTSKELLGQQPKEEIGAARFIAKNPTFDGRNVIVGVFDTGVDPGAPGLQTTPMGTRKVIDIVDCTGSGDVDTSKTASPVDGKLTGLSGRTLSLPAEWPAIAEGGKYHLGVKPGYELMPTPLVARMKAERRKTLIDEGQREAVAAAQRELREPREGAAKDDKKLEEELKARVAQLEELQKAYEDPGPVYDVVTYKDGGGTWRVCVDTSECGELASAALLAPYRLEQKYGTLDAVSLLNFGVEVLGEGARTAICVDAGAHGTHVAGIIGAHFPEQPELNGVAPGCQIIGFKIGDTRLGGMETGTALCRALAAALERGVHVINLSFGEYANVDDYGRFTTMARQAVFKHGLIFITSAGNNGPALTTGGAPGTSDCAIAVGAFASAAMMGPQYSLRANPGPNPNSSPHP